MTNPFQSLFDQIIPEKEKRTMIRFHNAYIASRKRIARRRQLANAGKLVALVTAVFAMIVLGVLA